MKLSEKGVQLIKFVEGERLTPYRDSGGALTIGVGHYITKAERLSGKIYVEGLAIRWGHGITPAESHVLFLHDVETAEDAVNTLVTAPLTQSQFDALVSFVFNVGIEAFLHSTLLKKLNRQEYDQVPAQFRRWIYDNGVKVEGLASRRSLEVARWQTVEV